MSLYSEEAYDDSVAYTFIQGTDHRRTGKLEKDLDNLFSLGVNIYQWDLANAKIWLLIIRTMLITQIFLTRKINN